MCRPRLRVRLGLSASSIRLGRKPARVLPPPVGATSSTLCPCAACSTSASWWARGCQPRGVNQAWKFCGQHDAENTMCRAWQKASPMCRMTGCIPSWSEKIDHRLPGISVAHRRHMIPPGNGHRHGRAAKARASGSARPRRRLSRRSTTRTGRCRLAPASPPEEAATWPACRPPAPDGPCPAGRQKRETCGPRIGDARLLSWVSSASASADARLGGDVRSSVR